MENQNQACILLTSETKPKASSSFNLINQLASSSSSSAVTRSHLHCRSGVPNGVLGWEASGGVFGRSIINMGADDREIDERRRLKISRATSSFQSLFPGDAHQMLNFSSWKPVPLLNHHSTSPFFFTHSSTPSSPIRNSGNILAAVLCRYHHHHTCIYSGGVLGMMRGGGFFTHSQWFELERQSLIYNHIHAKLPIPSYLLFPSSAVKPAINAPSLFPFSTAGSAAHKSAAAAAAAAATLGCGSLHLGFSGNADPEPGRCRRTDGKKWRCSRDAVSDQKYCDRHMNRGRHRSRKRVEGQTGHAPTQSPSSPANNLPLRPAKTLLQFTRSLLNNKEDTNEPTRHLSVLTYLSPNSRDNSTKNQNSFKMMSHRSDFGLISTHPPLRRNYSSENLPFLYPDPQITDHHRAAAHPFPHFIDGWSGNQSTELSISIPVASSDFSSSSSSPNQDKMSFSPLTLSCEFNPLKDGGERCSSWIPICWEPTVGGPLGEVLTNTGKDLRRNLSSSSLNLLTESPTGVLHKSGFGSLSSSARSSPRADNIKARANHSDELISSINPC